MYWPARAAFGDIGALAAVLGGSLLLLIGSILLFARQLGECAIAASGVSAPATRAGRATSTSFHRASPARALRLKEWMLLRRDPWLVSQSLMQILYLLPPAFLLWRDYGAGEGALTVLVPVLVMAAGQLAGGLAWLAISGEDAPELVATAPVPARRIVRAKIEAVMSGVALVFLPFVIAIGWPSPWHGACDRGRHSCGHRGGGADPALVPHPGQAQALPTAADLVARCDLCGGVLVDRLGRHGGARRGRLLVRRNRRPRCCRRSCSSRVC